MEEPIESKPCTALTWIYGEYFGKYPVYIWKPGIKATTSFGEKNLREPETERNCSVDNNHSVIQRKPGTRTFPRRKNKIALAVQLTEIAWRKQPGLQTPWKNRARSIRGNTRLQKKPGNRPQSVRHLEKKNWNRPRSIGGNNLIFQRKYKTKKQKRLYTMEEP